MAWSVYTAGTSNSVETVEPVQMGSGGESIDQLIEK